MLSERRLHDLGAFAVSVDFQLVPWLRKERCRACRCDACLEVIARSSGVFSLANPYVRLNCRIDLISRAAAAEDKEWTRISSVVAVSFENPVQTEVDMCAGHSSAARLRFLVHLLVRVEDAVACLRGLHSDFSWPYPAVYPGRNSRGSNSSGECREPCFLAARHGSNSVSS